LPVFSRDAAKTRFLCLKGQLTEMARPKLDAEMISLALAQELGYELVETAFDKESAGMYLRIYLDKPGGMSLSDCETFHRAVQPKLDHVDYDFLEVSSPGIDRPIRTEGDVRKALGAQVEIRLFKPFEGSREHAGTLLGYEDKAFIVMTAAGEKRFSAKETALVKRVVDISVLEEEGTILQEEDNGPET
jgi:ribosome maturation factor RimP